MKENNKVGPANGWVKPLSKLLLPLVSMVDMALIVGSLLLVLGHFHIEWDRQRTLLLLFAIVVFESASWLGGLYQSWRSTSFFAEIKKVFLYWITSSVSLVVLVYFLDTRRWPGYTELILWLILAALGMMAFRILLRLLLRWIRRMGRNYQVAAIVGANHLATRIAGNLERNRWMGLRFSGYYEDRTDCSDGRVSIGSRDLTGTIEDLVRLAEERQVDIVYITLPMRAELRIKELIDRFSDTTVSVYYVPDTLALDMLRATWGHVGDIPVLSFVETPFLGPAAFMKRMEDLVLATLILALLAVPMLLVAMMIKSVSKGPVFYRQKRYGLDGKEFRIWKFRTMHVCESDQEFRQARRDDERVFPLGKFLRKTSFDEVPQLFNVLLGEMSVVGPRPHPVPLNEQHRGIIRRYMLRHIVKPGMTGLAQVHGYRGETDTLDKMEWRIKYDLEYIRNWSLLLDLKIIYTTLFVCLADPDAY